MSPPFYRSVPDPRFGTVPQAQIAISVASHHKVRYGDLPIKNLFEASISFIYFSFYDFLAYRSVPNSALGPHREEAPAFRYVRMPHRLTVPGTLAFSPP